MKKGEVWVVNMGSTDGHGLARTVLANTQPALLCKALLAGLKSIK